MIIIAEEIFSRAVFKAHLYKLRGIQFSGHRNSRKPVKYIHTVTAAVAAAAISFAAAWLSIFIYTTAVTRHRFSLNSTGSVKKSGYYALCKRAKHSMLTIE